MLSIAIIIILVSSAIGFLNYSLAKGELIETGKAELKHLSDTTIPSLELLNEQVEAGKISLEEAKETAREIIIGPKTDGKNGIFYDYTKSVFVYKEQGYVFAYDSDAKVAFHPKQMIGDDYFDTQNNQGAFVQQDLIKAAQSANPEDHYYSYSWKNPNEKIEREKIAYMVYYAPWDWNIGIGAYTDDFYSGLHHIKTLTFVISLVAIIISLSLFYFSIRKKVLHLSQIAQASRTISHGELNMDALPETEDEIGQLASAFNTMMADLRKLMLHLKSTSNSLVFSATNLSASSEESSASSEEVSAAMTEISCGISSQSSDMENTKSCLEELTSSIHKINKQNHSIKKIAEISKEATENGKETITILKDSNNSSVLAGEKVKIGVATIYERILDISSITKTIEYIAQQTNILALNASIEAARAGENGKGFAVVASEVRKHAEESNKATKKIQEMIKNLENDTDSTVKYMEETILLSNQLNDIVNDTEKEFSEIENAVYHTTVAVRELDKEIHSVTSQNNEINTAIQNFSAVLKQTAISTQEISTAIDDQVKANAEVSLAAEKLSNLSEEINAIINKYKF